MFSPQICTERVRAKRFEVCVLELAEGHTVFTALDLLIRSGILSTSALMCSETFALFGEVYRMQKDMIMTAGFIGFILWVCFAAVMHFSERHNPDAEVRSATQPLMRVIARACLCVCLSLCMCVIRFPFSYHLNVSWY